MDYTLLAAGVVALAAAFAHTIAGDRECRLLKPEANARRLRFVWQQARCGWHMAGFDLFALGGLLVYSAFNEFEGRETALTLAGGLFSGHAVFWLGALIASRAPRNYYYRLGQWALLLALGIAALVRTI